MVIEQPLRSTDEGKVKLDLGELIRIIWVLSSLSFNLFTVTQDLNWEMHDWVDDTKLEISDAGPVM